MEEQRLLADIEQPADSMDMPEALLEEEVLDDGTELEELNEEEGQDDDDELTICEWTPLREKTRGGKSFVGKLATESLDLVGGNGSGVASAYAADFVRWFATTDLADSTHAISRIVLTRTKVCDDPNPVMELEAISTIKVIDTSRDGGYASSAAVCLVTGDLELTNQTGAVSGSTPTGTTISMGVVTIQPFTQSEGRVAPPDSVVPKREVKEQADGTMLSTTSLAVKVSAEREAAEAESQVEVKLEGHMYVRCRNCAASARIDY